MALATHNIQNRTGAQFSTVDEYRKAVEPKYSSPRWQEPIKASLNQIDADAYRQGELTNAENGPGFVPGLV
jgi:hypothetical protein